MKQNIEKVKMYQIAKDKDCNPKNFQAVKEHAEKATKIRHPKSGKSL